VRTREYTHERLKSRERRIDLMPDEPSITDTLDCVGLYCPVPLLQAREKMDELEAGDVLEFFADDPAAEEDLTRFAKRTGHEILVVERDGDDLRMLIKHKE
jgi:TusA-related sulfurtransferase